MRIGSTPLWSAVLFLYFPSILMGLGQGMVIPALPLIGEAYDVPGALAAQVLTVQLLGRMITLIPAGALIDRFGVKPSMVGGALLASLSALAAAYAPTFAIIAASQLTLGMGKSIWMFGRELSAVDMVRREQRGRQMSALMGISSTGMAFGPALGGVIVDAVGVRGLFLALAAVSGIVFIISAAYRETSTRTAGERGPFFNFGAVAQIHPYFRLTYLILFFATFAQMLRSQVTNSMLPLYTQDELGYSATFTGMLFTLIGLTTFSMIVPTGFISDKLGRKWAAAPAAVLTTVGFVLFPVGGSVWAIVAASVLVGLANGLAMGAMTIYTYDFVPRHARAQLQAMRRTAGELGAVMSPPVAGVAATLFSAGTSFWIFAPLHALSAVLLVTVARESLQGHRRPGAPTTEEIEAGR